jgi:Zn finger protein HypA/HybF involved in hydrogenase expression
MPEGMQPPPNTLMLLRYTISAPIRDRDRDVLRAEGGVADPKAPLLWQHMGMALIGKTVATIQQPMDKSRLKLPLQKYLDTVDLSRDSIKVVSALLDLQQPLTEDIAKMFEADALRFSHGFQAVEWEEIKSPRGNSPDGFDVKEWHRLEDSAVSIPSCTSAVLELFSRQKFHSDPIKRWAKSMHDSRAVQVKGFCLKHNVLPSVAARIPEQVIGVMEDAAEQPPIRWAKSMPACFDRLPRMEGDKLFDPAGESLKPATLMHDWVSKYLDVPIKRICESHASVPSAKTGAWLTALESKLTGAQVDDVRNIGGDSERPPQYEAIQLTSTKSDTFLVDGTRFVRFPEMKCVLAVEPAYFGIHATLYTDLEQRDANINFFAGVQKLADEYKFLKGEAFSLSGDFLTRDGSTTWDDVFLTKKNETAVRHATAMLAEKGGAMPSRGVMMLGPPGSGKTMSGRAMMNECKGATFIWIAARDFYHCGSFGGFSYAFDMAKELAPAILFFEDVDNWMRDTAVDLLKTEMDGLTQNKGILTVLTTNHPEQLPKALIDRPGRFHDVLLFDNPTEAVREKMIGRWLPDADDKQRSAAVKRTDGWSGAHVYELCAYAKATAEQDKLDTGEALVKSLDKIAEQRQLIDEVQGRRTRYEPTVWERAVTDRWLKAKADGEEVEVEEPESDEAKPMLVCDECEHEMPAPDGYDAEKPPKCPECETGTMMPKPEEEDEEAEEEADPEAETEEKAAKPRMIECPECGGTAIVTEPGKAKCQKCGEVETGDDEEKSVAVKSIREVDGEFCVFSEAGKNLGCYPTKPEAEDRLAQIERFSGKDGEPDGTKADDEPAADEPKPDEEEPAAKKLVCEDCGYSMPLDEATADEDGKYECPECGGKMNPAGEKDVDNKSLEDAVRPYIVSKAEQNKVASYAVFFFQDGKFFGNAYSKSDFASALGNWAGHVSPFGEHLEVTKLKQELLTKAGRVLSQRNMDGLVEAAADLEEAMDVDKVPRKCAALVERAHKRLVTVIDAAQPAATGDEARPDARPKEPTGKSAEKTLGQFLATAEANELSTIQEIIAARLDVIHRDARADALKSRGLI